MGGPFHGCPEPVRPTGVALEYAISGSTGKYVSATQADHWDSYRCPVCKERVSFRAGFVRRPHFAHWPGWGTEECENFTPGHGHSHSHGGAGLASSIRLRMELRLVMPRDRRQTGWWLEIVLPPCAEGRGSLTMELGGRSQQIDMKGMVGVRKAMTVELSTSSYRIAGYSRDADKDFVAGVERECPAIPADGAAVFTAAGRSGPKSFPRAAELRRSGTFAFLWPEAADRPFHDELTVIPLPGRPGWRLALVTIPDEASPECLDWLKGFAKLPIAPSAPSIVTVWPALSRSDGVNSVEVVRTGVALIAMERMPVAPGASGPPTVAQTGSEVKATGLKRSPALFALHPHSAENVRVSHALDAELELFLSFTLRAPRPDAYPTADFAFSTPEGNCRVIRLQGRRSREAMASARSDGHSLEYVALPPGCVGNLAVRRQGAVEAKLELTPGDKPCPHDGRKSLLNATACSELAAALADRSCHVDLDFRGMGRIRLAGDRRGMVAAVRSFQLAPPVRARLLAFLFRLSRSASRAAGRGARDDASLVEAFARTVPEPELVAQYRALARDLSAGGFDLGIVGDGISR